MGDWAYGRCSMGRAGAQARAGQHPHIALLLCDSPGPLHLGVLDTALAPQLKHRHEVLSKALELRDYNLRIMYDTSGTCPAPPPSWAMSLPRTPAGVMAALGRPGGCHQAEQQWFRQHQGPTGSTTGAPAGPAPAPAPASSLAEAVWMPGSVALLLDLTSLPPVDREK